MYLVTIAWMFVVVCMTAVEATTASLAGALVTLVFYGLVPLGLLLWLVGTPQRRKRKSATDVVAGASFAPGRRHESKRDDH